MVFSQFDDICISGIASAVPEGLVDIESLKETEDPMMIESFIKKTGIRSIHKGDFSQTASDFAYSAAIALHDAGKYSPEEVGVLIYITQTPDYRTPSTAFALHKRLGISTSCLVFDINLGCSGFVYGVSLAASLLKTSTASKALVLVGDTLARRRIMDDKRASNTTLLFGDASSAILLEKKEGESFSTALMSDGARHKALTTPYQAWKHPYGPESIQDDDIGVFNFTISEVPALIKEFLERIHATIDQYDALVLHQANMMILKQIAKKMKMPKEKVPISLDRFGNTSGASVPVTIVDTYGNQSENKTLKLLASGFGVGLSWGCVSFEIKDKDVLPLVISRDIYEDGYDNKFTAE